MSQHHAVNNITHPSLNWSYYPILALFLLNICGGGVSCFCFPLSIVQSSQHLQHTHTIRHQRTITSTTTVTSTRLDAFWNRNKNKKNAEDNSSYNSNDLSSSPFTPDNNTEPSSPSSVMATTASTMENFKQSQELGRRTNALLQDLASCTVEGTNGATGGGVKVFVNGRQEPVGVKVEDSYLERIGGNAEDLEEALTVAMRDAWGKSVGVMEDRMQSLYSELGLPSAKS